mmetsp:Transcript_49602/g.89124  ORF Transcript_49602/g.89124 Transcript_49602/m.89124 type:complete len:591 (-) Transcript_49602:145-1917(-)
MAFTTSRRVVYDGDAGFGTGARVTGVDGEEGNLIYTGPGTGAYERVESFRYVGRGGSYDIERKREGSIFTIWCLLIPLVLIAIVVAVLVIILLPRPARVTTTPIFANEFFVPPATSTMPFDCKAGYWNWEKGWSGAKKQFCCDYEGRGCPVLTTSLPFDCDAGYSNWQNGWSEAKKSWCCSRFHKGCMVVTVQTSLPYDCHAGLSNAASGWSEGKKLWCCGKFSLGCPTTQPYDCDAGYSNWQAGWSGSKKNWCCQNANRGCEVSLPYDCDAGYSNWHVGWSSAKKHWCCLHHNRGCPVLTTSLAPAQSCQLWGDPHVKSFDHTEYVFYRQGDFWIVKSDLLQVQGRFQATEWTKENDKTDYSSLTGLVVSGSLINGRKIEIAPMENNGQITCDGRAILHGFGEDSCGAAKLKYGADGMLIDSAMSSLPHRIVHITLPSGIIIQANRWPNFMNLMITMRPIPGQDGVCGNNNYDKSDDSGKQVHERFGQGVPASELLFSHPIPLHVPTSVLPSKKCTPEKRHHAEEECKNQLSGGWALAECMSDVCAGDHPVSQPQIYDCKAGESNWRAGWSTGKKKFCCVATNGHAGCQ